MNITQINTIAGNQKTIITTADGSTTPLSAFSTNQDIIVGGLIVGEEKYGDTVAYANWQEAYEAGLELAEAFHAEDREAFAREFADAGREIVSIESDEEPIAPPPAVSFQTVTVNTEPVVMTPSVYRGQVVGDDGFEPVVITHVVGDSATITINPVWSGAPYTGELMGADKLECVVEAVNLRWISKQMGYIPTYVLRDKNGGLHYRNVIT